MKIQRFVLIIAFCSNVFSGTSQVKLEEGFETGLRPAGWTEELVSGNQDWRYRNGGHNPNDPSWETPANEADIAREPSSAYEGTYNAIFFIEGTDNQRTKLITPELDLLGGTNLELSFYLCQRPWTFGGTTGWDVLRIYYKVSSSDPWVLIKEYLDPVYDWELQNLVLPNPSETYYVAFEGHSRWGYGTCIDNVKIEETGSQSLYIGEIDYQQPFTDYVPSGSPDAPIMRINFKVYGNTDSAFVENINFTSRNADDADLQTNGVKLYSTLSQTFSTENPVGSPTNFVSGTASFTGLHHNLPPGQSYLWLAYNIKESATHLDSIDVEVPANGIFANDSYYPATTQSPDEKRIIYQTQYSQDFEGTHNWELTGEFEINSPSGLGGSTGNPDPSNAYRGTKILGTDLTGLGVIPYDYEAEISDLNSYLATSPTLDLFYYKNLNLFFENYLNIEVWDHCYVQVSSDDGVSWNTAWESTDYHSDFQWEQSQIPIPDEYSRTHNLKIRFKLGPTTANEHYSGWNIDDIYLTGEFISKDVGVSEWIYPQSGSGHTASDSVIVRIENYGGAEITDQVPVAYSFDGGVSWITNNMTQNIPVGGSVVFTFPTKVDLSVPGLRPSVLARTMLPGDQYIANDQISTEIYLVPTYPVPYLENFEASEGFWHSFGKEIWEYGEPVGAVINTASSGTKSWTTGLGQQYAYLISQTSQVIFEDNFEIDRGWTLAGEFERISPSNMYPPYFAYWGSPDSYCIGTDLTGQGDSLYKYEHGITEGTAYTATSPAFDVTNYSNLNINFQNWIGITAGDSLKLEVSMDNGANWQTLWENSGGEILHEDWYLQNIDIHDSLSYTSTLRFRFSLFYSAPSGINREGWNIDSFVFTGDLADDAPGYLASPSFDLTGMVKPVFETSIWTDTEQDVDGATLYYSLDDGNTWTAISNTSGYDSYWNWYTGKPVSALGLNGWSGHSGEWLTAKHLLPAALLGQDNVQFRFKFAADKLNNYYDGIAIDDIQIHEAPQDIGVFDIINPVTACELSDSQVFTLSLENYGEKNLQSGDSIVIGYYIDRSGVIQTAEETLHLTQAFNSGATKTFTLSEEFDFSVSGEYLVDVFTIEPDPYFYQAIANDTASSTILVNKPVVDLGPDISTVRPDTVVLSAYSGINGYDYLWQDSSTDSVYHVSTEGTYYVDVTNSLGCVASDTANVLQLIADAGVSELVSLLSACEHGSQVPINIKIANFGTDTLNIQDTIFVFGDINQSIFFSDTMYLTGNFYPGDTLDFSYTQEFDFSAQGTYNLKLYTQLTDDFTNSNDTLNYALEVYGYPVIDLGEDITLLATEYILQATPGYFEYLWQDGSTGDSFTVDQPGSGLYHVTVSDEHQCTTYDEVNVTLNVIDVAMDEILSPATACGLSETITVSARISNPGNITIPANDSIFLGYMIEGSTDVRDTIVLDSDFTSGSSIDFVFSQTENVVTGQWYDFTVYLEYKDDIKEWNDTIIRPIGVFATPDIDLGEDRIIQATEYILDAGPGFITYEWQDLSTAQTFTVTEPGIGVYDVTVTDGNGCPAYDTVQIMLAVPDIGILEVVNPQTTCTLGATENVQVAIKNFGNWSIDASSNISVSYSINGGAAVTENIVLSSIFENGDTIYHSFVQTEDFSTPANYQISANTAFGSDLVPSNDTLEVSVDIFGTPDVDIGGGQDTILVYDPITLFAPGGQASYEWQDGNTNPSYIISEPGAGMYSVLVTDINGCSTLDSVYVAYDLPDLELSRIIDPASSCELDQDNPVSVEIVNKGYYRILTDSVITINYSVNSEAPVSEDINLSSTLQPGDSVTVSFSTTYDFSALGTYQLNAGLYYSVDENPSNDTIINNELSVWGYPDVEIGGGQDTMKTDLPVTLNAGTGYTSYLWQDGSISSIYIVNQDGLYWVMVTNENGCSDYDSVYIETLVFKEDLLINPDQIRIFPNPADGILYIQVDIEAEMEYVIELYSILNSLVYRKDLDKIQLVQAEIDVHGLAPGTYILRITADKVPHTYLVVVK